ncbi:MAG: protein prkA [Chloroflexi bacterium]|nr:protein prkA [Chloroflexota bacterium]
MITGEVRASDLLEEAEREFEKFYWEGTFADYLDLMIENPTTSRLAHRRVYDAIMNEGVLEKSLSGSPIYRLFETRLFGRDDTIERIVEYFASAGRRLETRKRILLLLGPPASGKSTIVALLKYALERFTRTDSGAVYGIKGCPMQEDPLHLIPHAMRKKLQDEHGLYIEGDLCPRCRFVVRTQYGGKISQVPVSRVVFSEQEAIGIGHYVATSSPTDASLLVGSVDTAQLQGDRLEVAGKAFRLDGELNVANRGLMEFGDIFKADGHLLTTLLGLAQEQLIKMDRFGSVYADEVLIAHSNEGDFKAFMCDESTEALRDRIVRIYVPYNLRVSEEVKIYQNMLTSGGMETIHMPPLTLPAISTFAVLSRMEPPSKQGVSLIDKLRAYDGLKVDNFSHADVEMEKKLHPNEGMHGISPRSVMNRLSARSSLQDICCLSALNAIDSLWQGRGESVGLSEDETARYLEFITMAVNEYGRQALEAVQKAIDENFESAAESMLIDYLSDVAAWQECDSTEGASGELERRLKEMERHAGISEKGRKKFRLEVSKLFPDYENRGIAYDYTAEHRLRAAIEKRLLPDKKTLKSVLEPPKPVERQEEWRRQRRGIYDRLIAQYGFCSECAEDTVEYVIRTLRGKGDWRDAFKFVGNDIQWHWDLNSKGLSSTQAAVE